MVEPCLRSELVTTAFLDQREALVHLPLKAHVEHTISFVYDDVLESAESDILCVLKVVQEAAWCADQNSDSLA